jgi:hypothetical protein
MSAREGLGHKETSGRTRDVRTALLLFGCATALSAAAKDLFFL